MKEIIIALLLLSFFILEIKWGKAEELKVHFSNAKFWSGTEVISIATDSQFNQLTNKFNNREKLNFKIESSRIKLLKGKNYLNLEDKNGNKLENKALIKREENGLFKAELELSDLEPGPYFISVNMNGYGKRRKLERLLFKQIITIDDQEEYLKWFQAGKEDEMSLGVGQNRQMGFKLSLGNGEAVYSNFKVNDYLGNRQQIDNYQIREVDGVYLVDLNLNGLDLNDDQWYFLSYDVTSETDKRYRGAKSFYVKDSLPEALIELPEDKSEVSGQVEVRGTAKDELFYHYYVDVEGKNGISLVEGIQTKLVEEDLLVTWDTDNFDKDNYSLRLTVVDWVGNQGQMEVRVKLKGHTKKFRLEVPRKVKMEEIEVLTFPQVSHGQMGKNNGKKGIEVEDDRGAYTGWSVTGSMTDFTSDEQVIELNNLLIQPQRPVVVKGQTEGLQAGGSIRPNVNEIFSFMNADTGYGNGKYRQQVLLDLDIKANISAGDYQSQLIITLQ